MSQINIACLLSPMADTEGPMDIVNGKVLTSPKKIMGKYGEIGLEAAITFGEENPDKIHTDIVSVGKAKEVATMQQSAIAMFQPAKHPGTLGVHALETDDIDDKDAFEVAQTLAAMIQQLDNKPDLVFVGRESWDYSHGVVGPAVAQALGVPYYSGVNEIKIKDDNSAVTVTLIEGNDKLVCDVALPAVFGTTDWLNGKDSARFTSLKGVMMAKKFKRTIVDAGSLDLGGVASRSGISAIEPVKSERKNRKLEGDDGGALARQAVEILVNQDKALTTSGGGGEDGGVTSSVSWSDATDLSFSNDVVVIADHDGAKLRKSTLQTLSQARKIADAAGKEVTLVVMAKALGDLGGDAAGHGAHRVVGLQSDHFGRNIMETQAKALISIFKDAPAFFVTVANDLGRDLAAYMAAHFGGGLLQDVVSLDLDGGALKGDRVVSNARFVTTESISVTDQTQAVSVRATAFDPVKFDGDTSFFKLALGEIQANITVTDVVAGEQVAGVPLNEAKIIISGGRGLKAADNFKHLHTLSDTIGGSVGASRAVTDLEWVPHNLQIGQTGTTVAPDVYFAVGISGAIQHLTGMLGSKYIVAINPDGDAPIHKHADLSILSKWEDVLEPMTAELQSRNG